MQQPPNQPPSGQYPPNYGQYPANQPYPPGGSYPPQPPSQPYPPQYGQYPPQQLQQPPKRKRWALGCGIAVLVVVVLIVGIAISASRGGQASTNNTTGSPSGQSTQGSGGSNPQTYAVGQSATLDGWVVTVNSVKTSQGGQYDSPKAGDVFLELDVSAKNETGSNQAFSSLISFKLKDATGQSYTESVATDVPTSPNGNVANGSPIRGTLTYEVPASLKAFTLDFTPSLTSTDTATWNIPVK